MGWQYGEVPISCQQTGVINTWSVDYGPKALLVQAINYGEINFVGGQSDLIMVPRELELLIRRQGENTKQLTGFVYTNRWLL